MPLLLIHYYFPASYINKAAHPRRPATTAGTLTASPAAVNSGKVGTAVYDPVPTAEVSVGSSVAAGDGTSGVATLLSSISEAVIGTSVGATLLSSVSVAVAVAVSVAVSVAVGVAVSDSSDVTTLISVGVSVVESCGAAMLLSSVSVAGTDS